MVSSLTYRTNDGTRWGGGFGSDLSATQVDLNFWTLFTAIEALEALPLGVGIDYINQPAAGNQFYIHLTDHSVLGPFTIPTAQWNPRGAWTPDTVYGAYDVVYENGSLYLIVIPHTSGATFSPFATDGMGHLLYNLLLQNPANELPPGGTVGQRLVKATDSPYVTAWESDLLRMSIFIGGQPKPSEVLLQYPVLSNMELPAGLVGSVLFNGVAPADNTIYTLTKNGVEIGTITFSGSPETISVSFPSPVSFVPGDILYILGPLVPDTAQANISFSLLATLTA